MHAGSEACEALNCHVTQPYKRQRLTWTDEENSMIVSQLRRLGTQWDRIAVALPGRTADAVRNQCHRLHKSMGWCPTSTPPLLDSDSSPEHVDDDDEERKIGSAHGRHPWTKREDRIIC